MRTEFGKSAKSDRIECAWRHPSSWSAARVLLHASLATRKEFITALRRELPEALRNLQQGNIAPVDLAQAAIGPGMAVFTRYAKVIESDGSPMTVRTALGIINQIARRSAGRAGRRVRRRHPLGVGVVRAIRHGRRPVRRRRDAQQGQEHGRQRPGRSRHRQGPCAAKCGSSAATNSPTIGTPPPTSGSPSGKSPST